MRTYWKHLRTMENSDATAADSTPRGIAGEGVEEAGGNVVFSCGVGLTGTESVVCVGWYSQLRGVRRSTRGWSTPNGIMKLGSTYWRSQGGPRTRWCS